MQTIGVELEEVSTFVIFQDFFHLGRVTYEFSIVIMALP